MLLFSRSFVPTGYSRPKISEIYHRIIVILPPFLEIVIYLVTQVHIYYLNFDLIGVMYKGWAFVDMDICQMKANGEEQGSPRSELYGCVSQSTS